MAASDPDRVLPMTPPIARLLLTVACTATAVLLCLPPKALASGSAADGVRAPSCRVVAAHDR